jgi:hypothetical protein
METVVLGSREAKQLFDVLQQQQQQQQQQRLPYSRRPLSPFATMPTTISSIVAPNFGHQPFFSSVFHCPIAIGSFFVFTSPTNRNEHLVGRIVEARKSVEEDHKDDHKVSVNLFIPFNKWPKSTTLYPIKDGLGKNLQEVVLTSKTAYFYFDRDVYDIGFLFTVMELSRRGAILQGIENVFVCRYYDDEEEVKDGELVPFPSMMKETCPVPVCFLARVFLDIETLRSQIYADLNRRGEQQGELTKTFNHIPFAWESWAYLKFKLSDRLAIPVRPLTNRFFLHRLTHDMKRTKFAVLEDADVMRFSDEAQFGALRSVLGSTICYGIRASRAKLSDKDPRQIPPGCAVNCVVASLQEHPDAAKFVRVPPASEGGFDLIHNGNNVLSLRTRYRKFHFETEDGESIPLENSCLPQHFQDILKPQNWGFWITETVSIKKGSLFDHDRQLYLVTSVFNDRIEARPMFGDAPPISFHDIDYVMAAIETKQGISS